MTKLTHTALKWMIAGVLALIMACSMVRCGAQDLTHTDSVIMDGMIVSPNAMGDVFWNSSKNSWITRHDDGKWVLIGQDSLTALDWVFNTVKDLRFTNKGLQTKIIYLKIACFDYIRLGSPKEHWSPNQKDSLRSEIMEAFKNFDRLSEVFP